MTQLEMMTSTELSGEGNVLDLAFEELDVGDAGLALVFACKREHLVGHIEAVGFASRADAPGGEEHVDAAAGAEVENGFAGVQINEGGGIAAAERGEDGFFRKRLCSSVV